MKKIALLAVGLAVATAAIAYEIKHPNLRDAMGATETAIKHIKAAQANNKGVEFGGHADKAIDLLMQAQHEIAEGDQYNESHRPR